MDTKLPIDVTITATLRPELLDRTLFSFFNNLFGDWPVRAIMNIDPVGGGLSLVDQVDKVCRGYFKSSFVIVSNKAHFGRAFKKIWTMAGLEAPFVFHLEDDWELIRKVSLSDMLALMTEERRINILRLPQNDAPLTGNYKDWNVSYPYNGQFYEVPANLRCTIGFCGHPSLIRSSFVRQALDYLDPEMNPEKQLKGIDHKRRVWLRSLRLGVMTKPGESKAIIDTGREWRRERQIEKKGNAAFFTEWS